MEGMKKVECRMKKRGVLIVGCCAVLALAFAADVHGQALTDTNALLEADTNAPAAAVDNSQAKAAVVSFYQQTATNRNLTFTLYPEYAPDIVVNGKKDTFGAGLSLLTTASQISAWADAAIAQHTFVMLRFDYLAHQAFATTGTVGFNGNVQVLGHNFDVYVEGGANIPFSGFGVKNGALGAIEGQGIHTDLLSWGTATTLGAKPWHLGVQFTAEKWTQFPGMVFLGGPTITFWW